MRPPASRRQLSAVAVVFAVCCLARHAAAQGAEHAAGEAFGHAAASAAPLLLAPSSVGPEARSVNGKSADGRFVLAWAMQLPLPVGEKYRHRLTLAPEIALATANHAVFRFRAGYRFGWKVLVAGAGLGGDADAFFVSSELGLRLPLPDPRDFSLGALLLLRGDWEPGQGGRRLSLMLGWVML
jgi:hypothetical protein